MANFAPTEQVRHFFLRSRTYKWTEEINEQTSLFIYLFIYLFIFVIPVLRLFQKKLEKAAPLS